MNVVLKKNQIQICKSVLAGKSHKERIRTSQSVMFCSGFFLFFFFSGSRPWELFLLMWSWLASFPVESTEQMED